MTAGGSVDTPVAASVAVALLDAARTRRPIEPLTDRWPGLAVRDAYEIQQETARRRLDAGERRVGWKLGLTSAAMQRQLGVDQPDYGPLLSGHVVAPGSTVSMSELIAPRVEAEIAFRLRRPLRGPGVERADAIAAVDSVSASLEIIDSRIVDWRIRLADTIADLASSARIVVADDRRPIDRLDLGNIGVILRQNGEVVAEGLGSAVLGDPIAALVWAANTLGALGVTLEPDQVVMPGAMHASVAAAAGDRFEADFTTLGSVGVRFGA